MKKDEYEKMPWYLDLTNEQKIVFETRLGILVGEGDPDREQMKIAWKEAQDYR